MSDVRYFQHSLLGYRVVYDSFIETPPNPDTEAPGAWNGNNCTWQFHQKEKGYNSINSQNRVQLWQGEERGPHKKHREFPTSGSDEASVTSQTPSESTAATSMHSLPATESVNTLLTKMTGSITSGQTSTRKDIVTVIRQPKKPVLFIFTMLDGKYTFIHIERQYFRIHYSVPTNKHSQSLPNTTSRINPACAKNPPTNAVTSSSRIKTPSSSSANTR